MFGTVPSHMCASCFEDEFAVLSSPKVTKEQPDWYYRDCVVPASCGRCRSSLVNAFAVWPFVDNEVVRKVHLPARMLADIASLQGKCQASLAWGTKPANAELQLTNLLAAERDAVLERAYLTVGAWAIRDEINLVRRGCCAGGCVTSYHGTPWKRWSAPPAGQAGAKTPGATGTILDAVEGGAAGPRDVGEGEGGPPHSSTACADAEAAERVDQQQRAFVEGTTLLGSTVVAPGEALTSGQAADDAPDIGVRVAHARFPHMGADEVYLHNADPRALEAANTLRNVGVGNFDPSVREFASMEEALKQLEEQVFTAAAVRKSLHRYEDVQRSALPRKLSAEQKAQWMLDAMNEAEGDGVSFSKIVKAFVKAEVTGKPKPRPIANHKEIRLVAMAKVAWMFEDIMFHTLEQMSIKHRTKGQVLSDIAENLSSMRSGRWCENDLTAFEFGIGPALKAAERRIFCHLAKFVGLEDTGSLLFERVVGDRDKPVVWSMTYKDETGEQRTFKLHLPRAMRESGDRFTSSGNFFQNLLAWLSFLVRAADLKAAVASLVKTHGKSLFYVSARDSKKYLARLVFEGDDTLGRCEEALWELLPGTGVSVIDDFFRRWGWKPKLLWKRETGEDYARVVGYDILLRDNRAVFDGDRVVACPEMSRLLNTKQWTTTAVTPEQRKTCVRIFAAALSHEYDRCEPFHAFCRALYDANQGGAVVSDELVRDQYLATFGELPGKGTQKMMEIEFADFVGSQGEDWKALARVTCGDFTDVEWAACCAAPDMVVHGADLRAHYPRSWVCQPSVV